MAESVFAGEVKTNCSSIARSVTKLSAALATIAAAVGIPKQAFAVRPFVTDDARIAARGQLEGETWLELSRPGGRVLPVYNALFNLEVLEWLELSVSSGLGWDIDNKLTLANPSVQTKLLFVRPESDRHPGAALVMGMLFPMGRGSAASDHAGLYVIAPVTLSLFDENLQIHANLGWLAAALPDGSLEHRPFWGVGGDVALGRPDIRAIAESFAGDPTDALGPTLGFQVGARWLASDYVNIDLAVRATPHEGRADGFDTSVQVGLRFLIDAFTGGRPVDPEGGKGMF